MIWWVCELPAFLRMMRLRRQIEKLGMDPKPKEAVEEKLCMEDRVM